uniref:myeloid-associated differentiation marker homolog n=1 Tax=Pristiophorus japonicus TaxID=55135 RepID=UPI00398E7039
MPVRFSELSNLTSPKAVVRGLQMLFACAAFSLAAAAGWSETAEAGAFAALAMFTWCFSFAATLLVFLAEFTQLHSLLPVSWRNLPVTLAAFAALMNLAASVSYPLLVLSAGPAPGCPGPRAWSDLSCSYQLAATICSCFAFLAYSAEVLLAQRGDQGRAYMATAPGLLKVLEVSLACLLAVTLATAELPRSAAYCACAASLGACALLPLVAIVTMVSECRCRAHCPLPPPRRLLLAASSLAALLAAAVLAAWSLALGRGADLLAKCSSTDCRRNRLLTATALFAVNLLAYVADLVYCIKLTCSRS